jgi:hypothetical protein
MAENDDHKKVGAYHFIHAEYEATHMKYLRLVIDAAAQAAGYDSPSQLLVRAESPRREEIGILFFVEPISTNRTSVEHTRPLLESYRTAGKS